MIRQPGDCPTGFYKSGNYCKEYSSESGREAIPRERGIAAQGGWYRSGRYCVRNGD